MPRYIGSASIILDQRFAWHPANGTYEHVWFREPIVTEEVAFEADVFLLQRDTAATLKAGIPRELQPSPFPVPEVAPASETGAPLEPGALIMGEKRTLRLGGAVPPEVWNRLGTKILPKLRSGSDLKVSVEFSVTVSAASADSLVTELRQILQELGLADTVTFE